ncbi:hypothetical protein Salat_2121800 [Sesamum alatum]|uniref:Uncharacterized protein n=1 Tax=Sesamum alatum TaxID=300844 RepID=A0AAE2CGY9_9LAMI|nr:hypothetical protein Salat_2121800 [Sesamum alatum]
MSKSEAKSLANSLESFEFLLGIVIWYDILFCINMGYRKTGFAASMNIAKELTFDMDVEPTFPVKRRVLRKTKYDENTEDEDYGHQKRHLNMTISITFSHGDKSDVDLNDLYSELKILQATLPNNFMSAIDTLNL